MGLLGDIRYMLTQSHYKRTTPYVCSSVCVLHTVQLYLCDLLWETNVGGMLVSLFDNIFISACVYVHAVKDNCFHRLPKESLHHYNGSFCLAKHS